MQFKLVEYINPESYLEEGFGITYRKMKSRTWERFEEKNVELTADEMKEFLQKMSNEGRFFEAVHDRLVWAWSEDYPPKELN